MKAILLLALSTIGAFSANFKTVPSEFPKGTVFMDGTNKALYLDNVNETIYCLFTQSANLFKYENDNWTKTTNYNRGVHGQIRKILYFNEKIMIWTNDDLFTVQENGDLKLFEIEFKEYDNVTAFGFYRRIRDINTNGDELVILSVFGYKRSQMNNFSYNEVLLYNSDLELTNYWRGRFEEYPELNDVSEMPRNFGLEKILINDKGSIHVVGSSSISDSPYNHSYLIYDQETQEWSYEDIGFINFNIPSIYLRPSFFEMIDGNLYISHFFTGSQGVPITFGNLLYKDEDWNVLGFEENSNIILPKLFRDKDYWFRPSSIFKINNDLYVATLYHGIFNLNDLNSGFSGVEIVSEDTTSFSINRIATNGKDIFAEIIYDGKNSVFKIEQTTTNVEYSEKKPVVLEIDYYDLQGNNITTKNLDKLRLYFKVTTFQDGNIKIKKVYRE